MPQLDTVPRGINTARRIPVLNSKRERAAEHARCTEANRRVRRIGRPGSYRAKILVAVMRNGVERSYHATKGFRVLALGAA